MGGCNLIESYRPSVALSFIIFATSLLISINQAAAGLIRHEWLTRPPRIHHTSNAAPDRSIHLRPDPLTT